jgi:predicted ArsR family transcriptional regulator
MPSDAGTPAEGESGPDVTRLQPRLISDPKMMRALAHPTRIALLEALLLHGSLTATEAGKIIGETPTNCAFHLRTLGRFGVVEEVGVGVGRSRRRPWRLRDAGFSFSEVQEDDEGRQAAAELAQVLIDQRLGRTRAVQALRHLQAPEWQEVLGGLQGVVVGTADEIRELVRQLNEVLDGYADRIRDPALRPPGSQPIEFLIFVQPFIPNIQKDS